MKGASRQNPVLLMVDKVGFTMIIRFVLPPTHDLETGSKISPPMKIDTNTDNDIVAKRPQRARRLGTLHPPKKMVS